MKIAGILKHRLYTYLEFFKYVRSRLRTSKSWRQPDIDKDRENNYWGYISSLSDEKRRRCPHTLLRKFSTTKFCCQDCGAELRYLREEVSVISELVLVALSGFLIYHLLKRIRFPSKD